jgi:hypothetical protein
VIHPVGDAILYSILLYEFLHFRVDHLTSRLQGLAHGHHRWIRGIAIAKNAESIANAIMAKERAVPEQLFLIEMGHSFLICSVLWLEEDCSAFEESAIGECVDESQCKIGLFLRGAIHNFL